jgi:transforming growth factor-beta-induced protein
METHMKTERTSKTRRAKFASVLAIVALGGVALGACGDDDDPPASTGTTTMAPEMGEEAGDIVAVATEAGDFSVLLAAAMQAGLVDELQGPGPLTVFAPTDDAFAAALEQLGLTQEELLADTETLEAILLYHVVEGEVLAAQVVELDGEEVETLNGASVTIGVDGDSVTLNDDVNVVATDIEASNGVIHVIDAVLLPPSE